jgi:hypothetical protein
MSVVEAWLFLQIFMIGFIVILLSEVALMIMNLLPSINFKWSLRFLKLGRWIMIGIFFLFFHLIQNESWYSV